MSIATIIPQKSLVDKINKYQEANELVYEVYGFLKKGVPIEKIKADLDNGRFLWRSAAFTEFREQQLAEDQILERPPEIKEGEMQCPKCKHKKTMVVEMQTRSADEGCTYFIHCFNPECRKVTKT